MFISRQVSAFHGDTQHYAKGNRCELRIYRQQREPVTGVIPETACHSWPLAVVKKASSRALNQYQVSCFVGEQPIACCGHGLLSSAYYWLRETQQQKIRLFMHSSEILASIEADKIWLRFTRLDNKACKIPGWTKLIFPGENIIAAATAGNEQGYLILQWPDDSPIAQLPRPDHLLQQFTQRALICTARQSRADADIHYRYFAPQYGVPEDTATGSAMRVLVGYWRETEITALQVSTNKGLLFGRFNQEYVEVGGYCSLVNNSAVNSSAVNSSAVENDIDDEGSVLNEKHNNRQ